MSAEDTRITADVRQAVLSDTAMSASARNCQIITNNGKVTLRGQVDSEMEKNDIEAKARAVAGVTDVDNQLEVK
jgi:osmotically-inducible protein OsmY